MLLRDVVPYFLRLFCSVFASSQSRRYAFLPSLSPLSSALLFFPLKGGEFFYVTHPRTQSVLIKL